MTQWQSPDIGRDFIFLTLRAEHDHPIEARLRLRAAVKRLLRDHGFRIIEMGYQRPEERHAQP